MHQGAQTPHRPLHPPLHPQPGQTHSASCGLTKPIPDGEFFPSSAAQLRDYLGIHHSTSARVISPHSWASFTNRASSRLSPLWKKGNVVPTAIKIQLWLQHSSISAYFDNQLNGTATSFSRFTWWIFPFLQRNDQASWESALGMQGYARFMDTILCPPRCPLSRRHRGCGRDVAPISTIHKHPSGYLLIHWAWDFLSVRDRAAVCQGGFPTTMVPGAAGPSHGSTTNVFRAYARLRTKACTRSISYLCQPRHPANPLPSQVDAEREFDNGVALLRYNFVYADFIRSMANIYTHQRRDHDAVWDIIDSAAHVPPAAG